MDVHRTSSFDRTNTTVERVEHSPFSVVKSMVLEEQITGKDDRGADVYKCIFYLLRHACLWIGASNRCSFMTYSLLSLL